LAEISCVKSANFKLPEGARVFTPQGGTTFTAKEAKWVFLPWNQTYTSMEEVATAINKILLQDNASISWNTRIKRFEVEVKLSPIAISKNLAIKLGFTASNLIEKDTGAAFFRSRQKYTANDGPSLGDEVHDIYVYSDIVQQQIVGDTFAPLLRIASFRGERDELVNIVFRPYYKPVAKLDFDTIEIYLCNAFGEEVLLERGECVVTLHFRKKNGNN
jgi:hypothetical protein